MEFIKKIFGKTKFEKDLKKLTLLSKDYEKIVAIRSIFVTTIKQIENADPDVSISLTNIDTPKKKQNLDTLYKKYQTIENILDKIRSVEFKEENIKKSINIIKRDITDNILKILKQIQEDITQIVGALPDYEKEKPYFEDLEKNYHNLKKKINENNGRILLIINNSLKEEGIVKK